MIVVPLALIFLAFNPRWVVLGILTITLATIQMVLLVWAWNASGAIQTWNTNAFMSVGYALALNAAIFVGIGSVVVFAAKRMRKREADEIEMLARLTQKSND